MSALFGALVADGGSGGPETCSSGAFFGDVCAMGRVDADPAYVNVCLFVCFG